MQLPAAAEERLADPRLADWPPQLMAELLGSLADLRYRCSDAALQRTADIAARYKILSCTAGQCVHDVSVVHTPYLILNASCRHSQGPSATKEYVISAQQSEILSTPHETQSCKLKHLAVQVASCGAVSAYGCGADCSDQSGLHILPRPGGYSGSFL